MVIAKSLSSKHWKSRLSKHNGSDGEKVKKTLIDILCIVFDPSADIPVLYAPPPSRLLPVGVENVDIASLLQEIASLGNEIHSLTQIRSYIKEIRVGLCHYEQS